MPIILLFVACSDDPNQLVDHEGRASSVVPNEPSDASAPAPPRPPPQPPPIPSKDAGTPGVDPFAQHNLDRINAYRASNGVAPLVLDKKLSDFAQDGSVELSKDHKPHAHFMANAASLGGPAGENQGAPGGWPPQATDPTTSEMTQIDQILAAMFAEGPGGGHYANMMNPAFSRLGVGLVTISGALYLTNDFMP